MTVVNAQTFEQPFISAIRPEALTNLRSALSSSQTPDNPLLFVADPYKCEVSDLHVFAEDSLLASSRRYNFHHSNLLASIEHTRFSFGIIVAALFVQAERIRYSPSDRSC